MEKQEVLNRLYSIGVIPVVRAESADDAVAVAETIREGGIPILEITLTVPGAVSVIQQLNEHYKGAVVVGAGTVLDLEGAKACVEAGSQFIVSPSLNLNTIAFCNKRAVPVFPGVLTPTEVVTAWQAG